ncbi:MAG: 50S ribosome-binding GTPase [Candidatus Heimdallarchaeota archaeon]|nr:TGS domain-containing protein [Candidatus Heimdallarchaeota archaeon]MCG3254627.1 50S ribosome-binding GTPase [Candidatus Heimdallarchaeota archaeon]MCK4609709.1 50S ribosome-binding GTPase [Candidatus Heimdallarchaeota archaeon]
MPKPYSVMMDEINSRLKGKVGDERAKEIRLLLKEIQFDVGDYRKIKDKLRRELKEIETMEQAKKASRKSTKTKKETPQILVIGTTNSGKSTLINNLCGTEIPVGDYEYTTTEPQYGALEYEGIKFQLVELPAISEGGWIYDKSTLALVYSTDCLLILGKSFEDFTIVLSELEEQNIELVEKRLSDGFAQTSPRRIPAFLVKKENLGFISYNSLKNVFVNDLDEIKRTMFEIIKPVRIFTMNSFNEIEDRPVVFYNDTVIVEDVVNKISKSKIDIFKDALILEGGPTGRRKRVGISYELHDNDVIHLTFHK